ncbi:hypothetical protein BDQ17DRAFT_1247682 [Cyathus striatus]|nr:hypothetical protein BDQ17DRAFT_1247682 [Cyathus striatus]
MPQIRHRPIYPGLKHDRSQDKGGQDWGAECSKYYAQYSPQCLTRGIMAAWCTHSICYGFHSMPSSEGRDDIFSALYTQWRVPPKWVIYDFACTLGPYCMTQEGDFFSETKFLIDHFHAAGHKKCSTACFLKQSVTADPQLKGLNSSAAECGNSVMACICKSVSYMGQYRATLYMKTFLCIWNHTKMQKLAGYNTVHSSS